MVHESRSDKYRYTFGGGEASSGTEGSEQVGRLMIAWQEAV